METKTKQEIKTFLPVFNGFYNSVWQYNEENVIYYINETRSQNIDFDNLEINYKEYETYISKKLCECIKDHLSEYIENIVFESLYSPKEYNFSTDSINCIITPNIENIKKFIYDNKDQFCKYLKEKYTSYDGFIAGYSNSFDTWQDDTNNFNDLNINGHYLGSILDFICNMLEIDNISLLDYTEIDNMQFVENLDQCQNGVLCSKCNKFVNDDNILNDVKKYNDIMQKEPSKILCLECLENN